MRQMGLEGVTRSRAWTTTTESTSTTSRPADLVDRDFAVAAPNLLWVADYTFVATWRGFCYTAFVIDAVALALNTRPRKTLTWRTPAEALDQVLRSAGHGTVATTP